MDACAASHLEQPLLPPPSRSSRRRRLHLLHELAVAVAVALLLLTSLYAFVNAFTRSTEIATIASDSSILLESWESAEGGSRLTKKENHGNQPPTGTEPPPDLILRVRYSQKHQVIRGFGGALTQASGTLWNKLKTDALRREVLESYFGVSGISASIARVPINSCDFADASYSADDVADDEGLAHFDWELPHDEAQLLPIVRAALAASPQLELLASPWSPPAWMKTNNDMNGNGKPQGLRLEAAAAWAKYISYWLSAFSAHGANVSMLTVQNEPQAPSPWEACYYDAAQEAAFISDHLGPALEAGAKLGRHPPVTLLGFDDQKDQVAAWSEELMGEGKPAASFVGGIAYHWYAGDHFDNLAAAASRHPSKLFLGTEATYELTRIGDAAEAGTPAHDAWVREGLWSRGEGYAHAIIGDLLAGSSGWIDWNILLDHKGGPNHLGNTCDAPLIADADLGHVYKHPQFYFLGHFAKFMPRGSTRIGVERLRADGTKLADGADRGGTGSLGGVYNLSGSVAYGACEAGAPQAVGVVRPDGTVALVVLNCADEAARVRIELASGSPLEVEEEVAMERSSGIDVTLPAHAICTYILRA